MKYKNIIFLIKKFIKRIIFIKLNYKNLGKDNMLIIDTTTRISKSSLRVIGNNNILNVKKYCDFNNFKIFIKGNNNSIYIDNNVVFSKGGDLWIEGENCIVNIGYDSTFELVHIAATENNSKIFIGNDCMFSTQIEVRTGDSHSIIDMNTNRRTNHAKDVLIGNHVWVGSNVSILKGSEISNNCILATRSIVTKKFKKSNVILGGVPAKILKENVNWKREIIYE